LSARESARFIEYLFRIKPVKVSVFSAHKWHSIALLLILSLLSSCQPTTQQSTQSKLDVSSASSATAQATVEEIAKSDNDARSYRYFELPNRLRVLLISAPNSDKAAAALDVNVGSRQDPSDRQGLAHFLEHMLFLGTDRYPQAGEYQNFISAHGGSHNAFTAFEDTNYFFDIDSRYLEPALDRFSRFFVAPLFSAEYVDREKHAVYSEYKAGIRDDQRRSFDVLREVVNPQHPFAKFSVGSLETLADRPEHPVRDDLLKFYGENYSANIMTLVVIGRESLDELQKMVGARFADVPNRTRTIEPIATSLFAPGSLPARVDIEPVQRDYSVAYAWPIGDQHADYRGKSLEYIGNILGHEGDGSLLSNLKQRGWAQGLSAGQGFDYRGGALFNISVSLTEDGSRHVDEITLAVYQAIARIRTGGIQNWLYREQQTVASQRFRFRDLPEPISEASHLAGNLQDYPAADVIRGDYLMEQFEPARINELLTQLTPQRMLMTVSAPELKTDRSSTFYRTPYSLKTLAAPQLQTWSNAPLNDAIRLPAPNIFVADDLSIKPLPAPTSQAVTKPQLLHDRDGLHLWFLQDSIFRLPKASITIDIHSPLAGDSAQHTVASELLVRVLRENLNEFSYPAALAGLSYDISRTGRSITLRVQGFNDKQTVLLERILNALQQLQIPPATFARVAADYSRELQDNNKRPPYQLLMGDLGNVLFRERWPDSELAKYAQSMNAAQLQKYARQLFATIDVDVLVHGNVIESDARRIGEVTAQHLFANAKVGAVPPLAVMQLPAQASYRRTVPAPHDDASVLLYRQAADNEKSTRAALGISAQLLNADFYGKLRTEQQLGYIVMSSAYPVRDVPGLIFLAQSPVAGPQQLATAYREFFAQWSQRSADELRPLFERHRAALAQRLAEAPKNFGEANDRLWQDLSSGYKQFDSREQILSAVQALTFEQWLPLFQRDVLAPEGHSLWLSVDGRFKTAGLRQGDVLGELDAFKKAQRYYSFP
jgi:insulysin